MIQLLMALPFVALTCVALAIEHYVFRDDLKRRDAYTMGVLTLNLGFTFWLIILDLLSMSPSALVVILAVWAFAGFGGITVEGCYYIDGRRNHTARTAYELGAASGDHEAATPDASR